MKTPDLAISSDQTNAPVVRRSDVVVVGGGPAGVSAAVAAARSGAFALDLRVRDRTTRQLASVQLSDARDEVLKAYKGIADLEAEDAVDIDRQQLLTTSMTDIIGRLNTASARVREITAEPPLPRLRDDLLAAADALESEYR